MRSHEKLTHVGVLDHMILAQNNLECDRQRCVPAADATDLGETVRRWDIVYLRRLSH